MYNDIVVISFDWYYEFIHATIHSECIQNTQVSYVHFEGNFKMAAEKVKCAHNLPAYTVDLGSVRRAPLYEACLHYGVDTYTHFSLTLQGDYTCKTSLY